MRPELGPLCWAVATPGFYLVARVLHRRHRHWFTAPLLVTWALCLLPALLLHVTYGNYLRGTRWLLTLLGPATMAFALPIYEQRHLIRKYWATLVVGVLAGSLIAFTSSWFLARILRLSPELRLSLLPRSVTTPFALDFAHKVGGTPDLTATCVVLTGLFGASMGELLIAWLPLRSAFARGALFGMGAHAVGTAKAREVGEVEGSVAGLTMVLAGLLSVLVAPLLAGRL